MNSRALRLAGPVILVATAVCALIVALVFGGGAAPLVIADPGPVIRWGLPAVTLVVNLSAAAMVGSLALTVFALRAGDSTFDTAMNTASVASAIFTVASGATAFFTFVAVFNAQPSAAAEFGQQFGRFLVETDLGRSWLLTTLAGAALTVLTFAVRGWTTTLLVTAGAIAALIPMATQGHSGEEANHNIAVSALALHIIGAAVWLGGLILVVILRPTLTRIQLTTLLGRYSTLALLSFVVVALSGTARAVIGLVDWKYLASPYGVILLVKVVALVAIGVLGAWYRRRLIGHLADTDRTRSRHFWSLIGLELAFMGVASGAAVALSRTPAPVDTRLPNVQSPSEILTGVPLPPDFTIDRWLTAWDIDMLWAFVVGFGIFFYLAGVWRLRRRGDRWPIYRTISWVGGMLLLGWVTSGPMNAYQDYLFSVHMLGHMLLTMAIPLCLVPGAPITLAARAIAKREDGTRGIREWILWGVHSPFSKVVTHPLVAAALFVGSLWIFYYTDLFRWSLYDHIGHEWMVAHFLITGYLFVLSLIGIDPVPYRFPWAFRLLTLIAVMAMHAFFGIAIMMQSGLMVSEWFGAMGRTWGQTPMEDQYTGGGIAWSVGEIPTLILAITVAIQWSRSDDRAQRRGDRQADRDGDHELTEYNERLAAIAAKDAGRSR